MYQPGSKLIIFSARLAPVSSSRLETNFSCCPLLIVRRSIFVFIHHNDHKPPAIEPSASNSRDSSQHKKKRPSNKPFIYDHHLRGSGFDFYYIYLNPSRSRSPSAVLFSLHQLIDQIGNNIVDYEGSRVLESWSRMLGIVRDEMMNGAAWTWTAEDDDQWETHNHYQSDCELFSESFFGMARDENYFVANAAAEMKEICSRRRRDHHRLELNLLEMFVCCVFVE